MGYTEILRLRLTHEYFGIESPPLDVTATDPFGLDRAGCLLRKRGGATYILVDEELEDRPAQVSLTVSGQTQQVMEITQDIIWGTPTNLAVPLAVDTVTLSDGESPVASDITRILGSEIAQLKIDLPHQGTREVTLSLKAVETHWAYHLMGMSDLEGLAIVDPVGSVDFEDLGLDALPDGKPVRVLRSKEALPTRARPAQRFALQKSGPFGPETLIAVLPAGAPPFKPIPNAGAPLRLQSNIFVTLW